MKKLNELLEEKFNDKKEDERLFFVPDDELNKITEIQTTLENGLKVYDPVKLYTSAAGSGYWCEADYIGETGGYYFEKL